MTDTTADLLPVDPLPSTGGNVPAWLHLAVAWSLALAALIIVGVLLALGVPVPAALWTILGMAGGGALGLTNPLPLMTRG